MSEIKKSKTKVNQPAASTAFFGSGEMGELMRSLDWSKTAVGPVKSWPQSLKTTLSLCLGSKFPMFVWWGPELTAFYNDAYIPIAGPLKHPRFLGASAREQWAEVWDTLGPLTDQVIQKAAAVWFEDFLLFPVIRQGFSEETYFTFTYSPIRDESGEVGGVFCACQETTKRVLGERRLRNLRELGNKTTNSRSVEAALDLTASVLSANPSDVPFALIYTFEGLDQSKLVLKSNTGTACNEQNVPRQIILAHDTSAISQTVSRALREHKPILVEEPMTKLGDFARSPFLEPLRLAVVLPIASSGQEKPAGVLIVGVSPRLLYDEDYQGYVDLISGQIATAVSTAKAYEEEKKHAEALAQIDRAKTAFFANVSHEFRTPLTLMLGPLEDNLAEPNLSLKQRGRDQLAYQNALRLLRLVNSLLDFSRIEAGRMSAVFRATNLSKLTTELSSVFRSAIEKAGLKLKVDAAESWRSRLCRSRNVGENHS